MKNLKNVFIILCLLVFQQTVTAQTTITINSNSKSSVVRYINSSSQYEFDYDSYADMGRKDGSNSWYSGSTEDIYRSEHAFSLGSIPSEATITQAKLYWYVSGSGSFTFDVTETSGTYTHGDLWSEIGNADIIEGDLAYSNSSKVSSSLLSAVNDARASGEIYLGAVSNNEGSNNTNAALELRLEITYTMPVVSVDITAKNSFDYGTIKVGNNAPATQVNSPFIFTTDVGNTINLEAQDQLYGDYERVWNTSGVSQSISYWDKTDGVNHVFVSNLRVYNFQVAEDDDDKTYIAELMKNYKIDRDIDCSEFDDILSNSGYTYIVEHNSGSIGAPATRTVNSRTYHYVGWADDFSASNPRAITPNDNMEYSALYKYPHYSNNDEGYSNTSARKVVKTVDPQYGTEKLWIVYESKGKVWLETSINDGVYWSAEILNDGVDAKNPSITTAINDVLIAYQYEDEDFAGASKIRIDQFNLAGGLIDTEYIEDDLWGLPAYSNDFNISIESSAAQQNEFSFLVMWEDPNGIGYKNGIADFYNGMYWHSSFHSYLSGTSSSSGLPAVAVLKDAGYPKVYHVAWQEGAEIDYCTLTESYQGQEIVISKSATETPTRGSGYEINRYPSMMVMDNGTPRLTWVGIKTEEIGKIAKSNDGLYTERRAVLRGIIPGQGWGSFIKFDYHVTNVNINRSDDDAYVFSWVRSVAPKNRFIQNSTWSITNLSTSGDELQLSSGATKSEMFAISHSTTTSPYAFTEDAVGNHLIKTNNNTIAAGREGIVSKEGAQFFFTFADVMLDEERVEFVSEESDVAITSLEVLNGFLETKPFELASSGALTYSVQYGVVREDIAFDVLTDNDFVQFSVELIDNSTEEILGRFDDIVFTKNSMPEYSNIAYNVDPSGIGNKTVKLRLKVATNMEALLTAGSIFADEAILAKNNYKNVTFKGTMEITDYVLGQNYPNPFNPETKINFSLPVDAKVSVNVFDILGRKVAELMDGNIMSGHHEVVFNASNLTSGVYIYKLEALGTDGSKFSSVQKMMVLK